MPLGVEELQVVRRARDDAELRRRRVEIERLTPRRVEPPEVDGELSVDEDPKVVVSGEAEPFASVVLKPGVQLRRKTEVVMALVR